MNKNYLLRCLSIMVLTVCVAFFVIPDCMAKKKDKNKAENVGTTVTLVTTGTGSTKEDAIKNALRTALEQTYGAFVSSNTQMINEELVKDEIVSISTGNVVKYEELSFIDTTPKQVTVKAVISVSKLINYARNKGMSTELAGNTFAMNVKLEELNKQNRKKVLENLLEVTREMGLNLFDYKIQVGNPSKMDNEEVEVPVTIFVNANQNTISYFDIFHNTLSNVLSSQNAHNMIKFSTGYTFTERSGRIIRRNERQPIKYDTTDPDSRAILYDIEKAITSSVLLCEVVDNLGNVSGFRKPSSDEMGSAPSYNKNLVRCPNSNIFYQPTNKLRAWAYAQYREGTSHLQFGFLSNYRVQPDGSDRRNNILIKKNEPNANPAYWLGIRPIEGETLYKLNVSLYYGIDEISKISKIIIRPQFGNDF